MQSKSLGLMVRGPGLKRHERARSQFKSQGLLRVNMPLSCSGRPEYDIVSLLDVSLSLLGSLRAKAVIPWLSDTSV